MHIWVDADACPRAIKGILYRAAERVQVKLTLVANKLLRVPASPWLDAIQVGSGFDKADRRIVELMQPGDLVVTADIPLAADAIEAGGLALDPRGELYSEENIGEKLAVRNLMDELRSQGMETGGPPAMAAGDRQAFANALDRILTQLLR